VPVTVSSLTTGRGAPKIRSMRIHWTLAGALSFGMALAGCTSAKHAEPAAKAGIAWNTTYESALADAAKNKRPIVLDFYTDW